MSALCLTVSASAFASQLTAILQSGDKITPFYGADAFKSAHAAAVNGDIITLSPGVFNTTEIQKSITLIGSGAFNDDDSKDTSFPSMTVSADSVTIEGIRIWDMPSISSSNILTIKGADQLTARRCKFYRVNDAEKEGHKYHDNTIFNDCLIYEHIAMSLSQNMVLQNCCVNYFKDINDVDKPALIENCNIPRFVYTSGDTTPSTVYTQPYAVYRSCFLGLQHFGTYGGSPSLTLYSPSEFHNNLFFQAYYYASSSAYSKLWTIRYGSCAQTGNKTGTRYDLSSSVDTFRFNVLQPWTSDSVSYGPSDFKADPAIPKIISAEIDTETDADGNLHVKINAESRD